MEPRSVRGLGCRIGETYGYTAVFSGIGVEDAALGAPTQMAVFSR